MYRFLLIVSICLNVFVTNVNSQEYVAVAKSTTSNLWGFINKIGDFILPPIYKFAYGFEKSGLAPIYDSIKDEVFYINLKGDTVLRTNDKYELLKPEGGNLSLGRISEGTLQIKLKEKLGVININGNIIIEPKFDKITPFSEGYAVGKIGEQYYLLQKNGIEILIDYPNIKEVGMFSCGRANFEIEDGSKGYIGTDAKVVIEPRYLYAFYFKHNLASVKDSINLYGVIDTVGNWVIKPSFRSIYPFEENYDYTIAIDMSHRQVILSNTGKVKQLDEYLTVRGFSEGLASATAKVDTKKKKKKKEERWRRVGYIDTQGTWSIAPSFNYGNEFKNGLAIVRVGRLWGAIDTYGLWVVKPQFIQLGDFVKVEVDAINMEESEIVEPEIDYYDIVKYIELIDKLKYANASAVENDVWKEFYSQDLKFVKWLLSFKHDVNNYGLWKKAKDGFINSDVWEVIEKNDSEVAKMLICIFFKGQPDLQESCSYNELETFLNDNNKKDINELRELWNSRI